MAGKKHNNPKKGHKKPKASKSLVKRKPRKRAPKRSNFFVRSPPAASEPLNVKMLEALRRHGFEIHKSAATETTRMALIEQQQMNPAFTSIFLVNLSVVISKYQYWTKVFPKIRPLYAVKSNPDDAIVFVLKKLGAGFDCASLNEIALVKKQGVSSKDILFANPCKGEAHIDYAKRFNVTRMTFDNVYELEKMFRIFPKAELILRILPYDTSRSFSLMPFGKKFGANYEDCVELCKRAKELGAKLVGVSFHVGSGCYDIQGYVEAIQSARRVFDLAKEYGHEMTILDIGGGWPGNDEGVLHMDDIAVVINPLLDELFPTTTIIAEPGRFFCTECCTLACVVTSKRAVKVPVIEEEPENAGENKETVVDEEEQKKLTRSLSAPDLASMDRLRFRREWMYYLTDGVYGMFNSVLCDKAKPMPFILTSEDEKEEDKDKEVPLYYSILFGPTCDSIDVVCERVELPELEIGSWLFFPNMGAYTISAASNFNGFEPPPRHYVM